MNRDAADLSAPTGGIWTLAGGVAVALEHWDVGPAIVLVPTEKVLLLAVDLPLASRAQRLTALPFAIEDRIADQIDLVHVALGTEVAPRTYLAGAVRHAVMHDWIATLDAAGLAHAAIVPDALLLPAPPTGSWAVEAADGRIIVRTDSGAGFAVPVERFVAVWTASGALPCVIHGAPLPFDLPMSSVALADMASRRSLAPGLDLRQGRYAAPARPVPAALRRLGIIVAAGLLAHTAIAAADTIKLRGVAAERRSTAEALVRQMLPGTPLTADLDRLLPDAAARSGRFLPLLVRASAALGPIGGLTLTRLGFAEGDGALTLGVEAADIGGLQRAQAALVAAGLGPVSGAATAAAGRADGDIVVRGAAA
jgi:general secretion pathway protein L